MVIYEQKLNIEAYDAIFSTHEGVFTSLDKPHTSAYLARTEAPTQSGNYTPRLKIDRLTCAASEKSMMTNINYWGETKKSIIFYTQVGIFQAIAHPKISSELTTTDVQSLATFNLLFLKLSTYGPLQTFIWRPGDVLQHTPNLLGEVTNFHIPLVPIKMLIPILFNHEPHTTILVKQPPSRKSSKFDDSFHASKFRKRESRYSKDNMFMDQSQWVTKSKSSNLIIQTGEIEKNNSFNKPRKCFVYKEILISFSNLPPVFPSEASFVLQKKEHEFPKEKELPNIQDVSCFKTAYQAKPMKTNELFIPADYQSSTNLEEPTEIDKEHC
ncbi:unnamed protein product [Cochlearia groenlandica]